MSLYHDQADEWAMTVHGKMCRRDDVGYAKGENHIEWKRLAEAAYPGVRTVQRCGMPVRRDSWQCPICGISYSHPFITISSFARLDWQDAPKQELAQPL